MSVGLATGSLLVYPFVAAALTPLEVFLLAVLFYCPTTVQIYYQRYAFKVMSRFLLGNGIALALGAALVGHPAGWAEAIWRIGFLAIFIALFVGTLRWRARHLDVPCHRCPEGQFPFCSWRLKQLDATVARHAAAPDYLPEGLAAFVGAVTTQLAGKGTDADCAVRFVTLTDCGAGHDASGSGCSEPRGHALP